MNTESLTTSSGSVDGQRSHAGIRNLLLDGLTLSSGAVDAISFLGLGKVFTAFMTGNIAFLGMRIGGSAVALACGEFDPSPPELAAVTT